MSIIETIIETVGTMLLAGVDVGTIRSGFGC